MFPQVSVLDTFTRRYRVIRHLAELLKQSINNPDFPIDPFDIIQLLTTYAEHFCRDLADAVDKLSSYSDADTIKIANCRDLLSELADEFRLIRIRSTFRRADGELEYTAVLLKHISDTILQYARLNGAILGFKVFECLEHAPDLPTPASLLP